MTNEQTGHLMDRWQENELSEQVIECLTAIREIGIEGETDDLESLLGNNAIFKHKNRIDLRYITLSSLDLSNIELSAIDFSHARFESVSFDEAILIDCVFDSAFFHGGSLQKADMHDVSFRHAKMDQTAYSFSDFSYADLNDALLVNVDDDDQKDAANPRRIKEIYRECGRYRDAGKQYYKEMTATKREARRSKKWRRYFHLLASSWFFGYGERPCRILLYIIGVILVYSLLYCYIIPHQICYSGISNTDSEISFTYMTSLYFTIITLVSLGYGDWHPRPDCVVVQLLASSEALIGFALVVIFNVALVRSLARGE